MLRDVIISDYTRWIKENSLGTMLLPITGRRTIGGGRSGAQILLVEYGPKRTYGVLKVNTKDEIAPCNKAIDIANKKEVSKFIAKIIHSCRIDYSDRSKYVVLYELASDEDKARMLFDYLEEEAPIEKQTIKSIVDFLFKWKQNEEEQIDMSPADMVKAEMGHKYGDDKFSTSYSNIGIGKKWFELDGVQYQLPNPCEFINDKSIWEDKIISYSLTVSHNDFHGGNILIKNKIPKIIDFTEMKSQSNIFYDLMYLEFHLLFDYFKADMENSLPIWINYCAAIAGSQNLYKIRMPKCKAAINFGRILPDLRKYVVDNVDQRNPDYQIMLITAAISVGLTVMRRSNNEFEQKAGFLYAAFYMKALLKHRTINMYKQEYANSDKMHVAADKHEPKAKTKRAISFKYKFIAYGKKVTQDNDNADLQLTKNRIFLDVGGTVACGAVDLHDSLGLRIKDKVYESAAAQIYFSPDLITENISDDAEEVEICVHEYPDFDCFASAYLVQYLTMHRGNLPKNCDKLVEYAEDIDKGTIEISSNCLNVPFVIGSVIDEIIKIENAELDDNSKFQKTLIRGIELVEYCMKRLGEISGGDISLYNHSVMLNTDLFAKEFGFIRDDFEKYVQDIEQKAAYQVTGSLLAKGDDLRQKIYGLIWDDRPGCLLHKYWARSDYYNSPDSRGFELTFIPQWNSNSVTKHKQFGHVPVSRVIISVKPNSNVTLKSLAVLLEKAELDKEEKMFGEQKELWRSRRTRRYPESWCTNDNPWYDGRDHGYSIVDSPFGGSLLSIKEIREIVFKFAEVK